MSGTLLINFCLCPCIRLVLLIDVSQWKASPFFVSSKYQVLSLGYCFHLAKNHILYSDMRAPLFLFLENDHQEQEQGQKFGLQRTSFRSPLYEGPFLLLGQVLLSHSCTDTAAPMPSSHHVMDAAHNVCSTVPTTLQDDRICNEASVLLPISLSFCLYKASASETQIISSRLNV